MAEDDLTLRMRAVGARQAAREVDTASKSVGKLDKSVASTSKTAQKGRNNIGLFSRGIRGIGLVAGPAAAALGIAGLAGTVSGMIGEFRDSQKVSKQTQAVIKSTGGVAKVSAGGISNLATALSNKTGIDDEAIQSGENMLLTFTNLRNEAGKGNDIFNQASSIMVDLGAAMHKGPGSASIMLGKALNDPTKGMAALRRVGVTFTAGQQKQVKALQKSGDMMGAQRVILKELNKEFGGSAAAQADPIDKMKVAWGNLQEMLGGLMWPTITRGITIFSNFVTGIQNGTGAGGKFRMEVIKVVGWLKSSWSWISKNRAMLIQLAAAVFIAVAAWRAFMIIQQVIKFVRIAIVLFKALRAGTLLETAAQLGLNASLIANPIGIAIVAITALVAAVIIAYNKVSWFRSGVNGLWSAIKNVFGWIKKNWPLIVAILGGPIGLAVVMIVKHFDGIKSAIVGTLNWIIGKINAIIGVMNKAIGAFNKLPGADIGKIGTIGQIGASGPAGPSAGDVNAATGATAGHAARGGLIRRPGTYEVGERGRERVHLPGGAMVEPHGGFGGEIVVPVTLVMPNGDVLARHVVRAGTKRKAAR